MVTSTFVKLLVSVQNHPEKRAGAGEVTVVGGCDNGGRSRVGTQKVRILNIFSTKFEV